MDVKPKKALQTAMKFGVKGIRIYSGGRLGGAEIARSEKYREGRVPLHTLRADIEFGVATLLGGEIVSTATSLHASRGPIPALDTQCHGLSAKELKGRVPFESEWERWVGLRRTGLLAAHNASVESGLLRGTWPRPSAVPSFVGEEASVAEWGPWIDTCRLARLWMPSLGDYRLAALVAALRLGPRLDQLAADHCPPSRRRYHCALYDALAAALVLRALCGQEGRSAAPLSQLVRDSLSGPAADDLMQGELGL
jgi:DNA polymerase-3 subunit epsilon